MFKNLIPWNKRSDISIQRKSDLANGQHDGSIEPVIQFKREMDRIWNRFWDDWSDSPSSFLGRRLDFRDEADAYVARLELPGFSPDDIEIDMTGNSMTVRAERKTATDESNGSAYQYGQFFESFTLPTGIDGEKIDARFNNGLLEIHLPKSESSKARRITVQAV